MKPAQGKKTKRKSSDLKNRELLNEVIGELKRTLIRLEKILDNWSTESVVSDICEKLLVLNLNVDGQTVLSNLKDSHIVAIKELKCVLKNKCKMLGGLLV